MLNMIPQLCKTKTWVAHFVHYDAEGLQQAINQGIIPGVVSSHSTNWLRLLLLLLLLLLLEAVQSHDAVQQSESCPKQEKMNNFENRFQNLCLSHENPSTNI